MTPFHADLHVLPTCSGCCILNSRGVQQSVPRLLKPEISFVCYPGDEFSTLSEEGPQLGVWLLLSVPGPGLAPQARSELCQLCVSGQLRGIRGQHQEDGDSLALQLRPPAASAWPRELRHSPQPRAPGQSPVLCVLKGLYKGNVHLRF